MDLDTRTSREHGVTFVSVVVRNPYERPARFKLEPAMDGPVWPPRRAGHPVPGWDETGYEGHLKPGECRGLGFATPEAPVDPGAIIAWETPATDSDRTPSGRSVSQRFADPRPPRSVLSPSAPVDLVRPPVPGKRTRGGYL